MERAELSIYLYNRTTEKAHQKYGPFICPSELSKLTNCLPRLFESRDLQISGNLEVGMKMPRWTGERHLSIIDTERNTDGEITVLAIDNLSAEDNKIRDIMDILCILKQTTGRDVLRGRALRTISGEEVDEECCLNGDHTILTIGSAAMINSLQESTPLPNVERQPSARFMYGDPPPINAPTTEDESVNRGAHGQWISLETVENMEERNDQSLSASKSPRVERLPLSETEGQDQDDPIRDTIADKSGSSSPMGSMPEDIEPLLSYYHCDDYEDDSMDKFPEGQEEHARRIELPTAKDLIAAIMKDEEAKKRFETAYNESFMFRERGGWIFANPSDPSQVKVVLAPISASKSFYANDLTTPSIILEDISTCGVPPGYVLVANFHTHPLYKNEEPSKADIENAYYRGMPGIVISRRKIFGYGPERRTNIDEPNKYAKPMEWNKSDQGRKLENNPFQFS